jgi:hypothetical protein
VNRIAVSLIALIVLTAPASGGVLAAGDAAPEAATSAQNAADPGAVAGVVFARPKEQWQGVVEAMGRRGSPVTAEEIPVIVDYLTKYFGPDSAPITAYAPDRVEHNITVIDTRTGAIKAKVPLWHYSRSEFENKHKEILHDP